MERDTVDHGRNRLGCGKGKGKEGKKRGVCYLMTVLFHFCIFILLLKASPSRNVVFCFLRLLPSVCLSVCLHGSTL